LTAGDIGPDQLYFSAFSDNIWNQPQPVLWSNHATPGIVPGYHANDPTVVHRDDNGWDYMYYTALADTFANATDMTKYNWIGFASSSDGGNTWYDHGIILGQWNGLDSTGAWSPSALIVNNEVWLYYHTNEPTPRILRTRLNINGWQLISTEQIHVNTPAGIYLSNVEIKPGFGYYWMVANTTDLHKIVLYLSTDGGNTFNPYDGKDGLLLDGGPGACVLTPYIQLLNSNNFNLEFGYSSVTNSQCDASTSIQVWNISVQ
jgi:hypothetical protein